MVEINKILEAIKRAKASEVKRKFKQSIDLIINLKEIDPNKEKIEECLTLPKGRGRKASICALIGSEMKDSAKTCDEFILIDDFEKWKDPRKCRKLARKHDFFIAQATIMPQIAQTFGKYFGPIGKMPNPKLGQIVPPNINLAMIAPKFHNSVKFVMKKSPVLQGLIGTEEMSDDDLAANAFYIAEQIQGKLPRGKENIRSILIKTTMGKVEKVA